MANTAELKAECIRKGLTMEALADKLNIHPATLYRKANGKNQFSAPELQTIRNVLGLTDAIFKVFLYD